MNGFTPVQFGFMVLFCHSFGNRSERPRALQLLIKMLIRCRLKWEERSLLYRAFVFRGGTVQAEFVSHSAKSILL